MGFQLSYFKSSKMMMWKCCTQYASKFGKLSSGYRTGKGQFSFQSQSAMLKNVQTTKQLHSFHISDSKSICLQWRRPGFDPWVRKICWRRKWQSTPVLLPGKSHEQRSLIGYSPWGHKESDMTERLHFTIIEDYAVLKWFLPTVFNNSRMKKQSKNWLTCTHRYIKSSTLYVYETIKEILWKSLWLILYVGL